MDIKQFQQIHQRLTLKENKSSTDDKIINFELQNKNSNRDSQHHWSDSSLSDAAQGGGETTVTLQCVAQPVCTGDCVLDPISVTALGQDTAEINASFVSLTNFCLSFS